jgi:predicted nucleic acid-binding protein
MMIESDIIYALVKSDDWLKPTATTLFQRIIQRKLGIVYVSREALHGLYYVSMEKGVSLDEYISRVASLTSIPNLEFLHTTHETDILALTIMKQFGITSIFDAYHAATCLSMVPDRTIISTDKVYDRVPGLKRVDPRNI